MPLISVEIRHKETRTNLSFEEGEVFVGRPNPYLLPQIDLSADIYVSRTHARLWLREGRVWIEDLNSKHGTFVNEVKLEYRRQLNAGDVVRVGETQITVSLPEHSSGTLTVDCPPIPTELKVASALNAEEASPARLTESKSNTRERMSLLLDLPVRFATCRTRGALLAAVLEGSLKVLRGAKRAAILLKDPATGELKMAASVPELAETMVSKPIARRAANEGRALIWRREIDAVAGSSVEPLELDAGMYAPVIWEDEVLGVLCVDNASQGTGFEDDDMRVLLAVASYAAVSIWNLRALKSR